MEAWLFFGIIAGIYLLVGALYLSYYYQYEHNKYENADQAFKCFINDLKRAKKKIVIACRECDDCGRTPENFVLLSEVLSAKKKKGVNIQMHAEKDAPECLNKLRDSGVINVKIHNRPLAFYGRIIDDKLMQIHKRGSGFYPIGAYLRVMRAYNVVSEFSSEF